MPDRKSQRARNLYIHAGRLWHCAGSNTREIPAYRLFEDGPMKAVVLRFPRSVRLAVAFAVLVLGSYGAYRLKANAYCEPTTLETVTADKSHYALGETALITGSGFAPFCNVVVRVTR